MEGDFIPICGFARVKITKKYLEELAILVSWSPKTPRKHQGWAKKWPKFQNIMENRPCGAVQCGFCRSEKGELSFESSDASDFVDREDEVVESLEWWAVVAEAE